MRLTSRQVVDLTFHLLGSGLLEAKFTRVVLPLSCVMPYGCGYGREELLNQFSLHPEAVRYVIKFVGEVLVLRRKGCGAYTARGVGVVSLFHRLRELGGFGDSRFLRDEGTAVNLPRLVDLCVRGLKFDGMGLTSLRPDNWKFQVGSVRYLEYLYDSYGGVLYRRCKQALAIADAARYADVYRD